MLDVLITSAVGKSPLPIDRCWHSRTRLEISARLDRFVRIQPDPRSDSRGHSRHHPQGCSLQPGPLAAGILLLRGNGGSLWTGIGLTRIMLRDLRLLIFWPWLAATALTAASLFLPAELVQKAWALPLWTNLAIPLAVVVLLGSVFDGLAQSGIEK